MEAKSFYAHKATLTGLQSACMACKALRTQMQCERNQLQFREPEAAAEKQCRTCEKSLPISSSFDRSDNTKGGYRSTCKECRLKRSAAMDVKRTARFGGLPPAPSPGDERRCTACERTKPCSAFYKHWGSSGVLSICKECLTAAYNNRRRLRLASSASDT